MRNETQNISSMEMIEIIKTYIKRNVRPEHYLEAPDYFLNLCEAGLYMGLYGFPTNILEKHISDKKVVNAYIELKCLLLGKKPSACCKCSGHFFLF